MATRIWIMPIMEDYHVYILANRTKTLYIGVTNNLKRRIWEHKSGAIPGFTQKYQVHRLVHCEWFGSIKDAIRREKQLKNWRRSWKVDLVETENPDWRDLAREWWGME